MRGYKFLFIAPAFLCLLLGLWTGLIRLGWDIPITLSEAHHGAIFVGGFLGTLISLEKVIPLRRKIFYAIPLISSLGALAFITRNPEVGYWLLVVASFGLAVIHFLYLRKHDDIIYVLMLTGAACWCLGNVMLLHSGFYPKALPWWMGFLVFTIVAERLELSKFLPVSKFSKRMLLFALLIFLAGLFFPFHGIGAAVSGSALVMISIWLMRYDVVRINIQKKGLTRFTGYALIAGYIALLLEGVFLIALPQLAYSYDIIVHTFFIGFVLSMIFAHGPIILPGVLGIMVKPYHPILFGWLAYFMSHC